MSLPYEYFKSGAYIKDLNKIEWYKVSLLYLKLVKKFKKNKNDYLKILEKLCNKAINILNDERFILNGYITVYQKNHYNDWEREAFEDLLYDLDRLKYFLNSIKLQNKINLKMAKKLDSDFKTFLNLLTSTKITMIELNDN